MEFPDWVQGPTVCDTRTFKIVLPRGKGHRQSVTVVQSFPQRETFTLRHIPSGRLHTAWADLPFTSDFEIVPRTED